jgi:MinD-like ATPase involved in chromosome partitioning or flagellar assembly
LKPKENIDVPAGLIIIVGNYGSGKTEVAVNLARYLHKKGENPVHLVDLDIVNPYFRSREAIKVLTREGIHVVAPEGENFYAELPIILPEVRTYISQKKERVILDVGGDDVGATVLASLKDAVPAEGTYSLWMVLNARRPFTDSVEGAIDMIRKIEAASVLKVSGIISNTHLLNETTVEIVGTGLRMARDVGRTLSLPLPFVAMSDRLVEEWRAGADGDVPVLKMRLTMLRPWEKVAQGGEIGA